jgi:short-subunit dehydrogenase
VRIVITGASSGIGEALARHYAVAGNVLGVISRRPANVQGMAATLVPYSVDVTDTRALEQAASDFVARFGAPDLVIANAGIGVGTSGEDLRDMEILRRTLEVNVVGLAATLAAFAPSMRKAGRGTLAGICSVAGFRGLAGNGAYSGSKSAAITWLESLRTEMHGSGVAVVCICPGYIDTPLTRVNRFRMPFLLTVDEGARRIARAIARRPRLAVVPWQMALVSIVLRLLPGWLYDRLAAKAPRKPRPKQARPT